MADMLRSRAEELKGKRTRENLCTAFAGESQARNKYTFFAAKARAEGYNQITDLFKETANNADIIYNFVIDEDGTLSVEDGGLIKEVSMEDGKKTYNIVNEWIADIAPSVPEDPSDSNSYNTPNIPNTPDTYSSFDNFRYNKGFEEPVSKDAVINDESTPLSKKDEDVILNEKDEDEDDENEDNESIGMNETLNFDNGRLKDDEIPLSAIPKTAEKMRFGFLVYLVTLLSGLVLFLGEVSDFVKRRKK